MERIKSIEELMSDARLLTRIKIENFILVDRGLRQCSQLTVPAELQGGEDLGEGIDTRILPLMDQLRRLEDPRQRLKAIESIKKEMRAAFKETIEASDQHRALIEWSNKMRLRSMSFEVRPTVRELYLFKDKGLEKRLKRLMKERENFRRLALRRPSPDLGKVRVAYPEEFEGGWLREMGGILGYPRCCVDRYAQDRERGISVEERAAQQLDEAKKHGEMDPLAYFVGFFFPCSPRCEAALSKGREISNHLYEISSSLGDLYKQVVRENADRVSHQPEIIAAYRAKVSGVDTSREKRSD